MIKNYKLSNTTTVIFIIFIIIIIISVLCIFYYISYKNNIESNNTEHNNTYIEGFSNTLLQVDNVIYYNPSLTGTVYEDKTEQLQVDKPDDGKAQFIPKYKYNLVLEDTYVIKQIYLESFDINDEFRIGIKNKWRNKISFVSGLDLNDITIEKIFDANSTTFINMTVLKPNSNNIYNKPYPLDIYGNDLVGNEIIIYNKSSTNSTIKATIMGHLENEPFYNHPDYHEIPQEIIDSTPDATTSTATGLDTAHGLTQLTFTNDFMPTDSKEIKVLFENNYSGNRFTFEGPLPKREFIITKIFKSIFFHHTLLANKIIIKDGDGNYVAADKVFKITGYMPSVTDINRFKLEYNLTDMKSSINPDDLCPSLDQYMNDQLSSEIVIDAMDYQDKINMEKMKLSSNKYSMLTLLEQEEDIVKLEKMVKKINSLHQQRKHSTNALNTLQLRRQMDEVLKLREVLDNRIALRKQNTINIPVDINRVKYVERGDNTQPTVDEFSDIPLDKSESMVI